MPLMIGQMHSLIPGRKTSSLTGCTALLVAVSLLCSGCAYTPVYLGMSQQEFLNGKDLFLGYSCCVALEYAGGNEVIYRDGSLLYYYFANERLVKMERGTLTYPKQPIDVTYRER